MWETAVHLKNISRTENHFVSPLSKCFLVLLKIPTLARRLPWGWEPLNTAQKQYCMYTWLRNTSGRNSRHSEHTWTLFNTPIVSYDKSDCDAIQSTHARTHSQLPTQHTPHYRTQHNRAPSQPATNLSPRDRDSFAVIPPSDRWQLHPGTHTHALRLFF